MQVHHEIPPLTFPHFQYPLSIMSNSTTFRFALMLPICHLRIFAAPHFYEFFMDFLPNFYEPDANLKLRDQEHLWWPV
jgi:hypothetical protein